jgi:hypothetical protein
MFSSSFLSMAAGFWLMAFGFYSLGSSPIFYLYNVNANANDITATCTISTKHQTFPLAISSATVPLFFSFGSRHLRPLTFGLCPLTLDL